MQNWIQLRSLVTLGSAVRLMSQLVSLEYVIASFLDYIYDYEIAAKVDRHSNDHISFMTITYSEAGTLCGGIIAVTEAWPCKGLLKGASLAYVYHEHAIQSGTLHDVVQQILSRQNVSHWS